MIRTSLLRIQSVLFLIVVSSLPAAAQGVEVVAPRYVPGAEWTMIEMDEPALLPRLESGWQRSTFWDLRPPAALSRTVRWSVADPQAEGLTSLADTTSADLALCATEQPSGRRIGCRLFRSVETGPTGPRAVWSSLPGEIAQTRRVVAQLDTQATLIAGAHFTDRWLDHDEQVVQSIEGVALAEGIALTPAGPQQVVLLREISRGKDGAATTFRFVSENGRTVARFNAHGTRLDSGAVLASSDRLADDGLEIKYQTLSDSLSAGAIGFLQYSADFTDISCLNDLDCPLGVCVGADAGAGTPGGCHVPLSDLRAGWTTIADAIGIDQSSVPYQPDPGDPGSAQTLPEVWEFATLTTSSLQERTFNTIRDDTGWSTCLESCAVKDQTATPADGSWQAYLKIDSYDSAGTFVTRSLFEFNDNDTGANPSIDVPYVVQDQSNISDRTQICFDDSGGTAGDRLLRFFQFTGPDPANAVLGVNDTWNSGNWTSCNDASGLHLTLASVCGDACYPGCPDGAASPRAQGLLGGGAGLSGMIQEDGYVHVSAGNYVPALLLLQQTDLEAGADLFGTCNISATRLRGMDWFWLHERYGLLALISGPNDDGTNACGRIQPNDWSCYGNRTDGADFTWGPFPPYQIQAEACLNGTRIDWALPADGSNLTGEPNITDWGYVVSWGTETDPDRLADWALNPNHTSLPGQPGYLSAPPGGEPTSHVITGFAGGALNATVVTALSYTDPDAADTSAYRSAAFFKVVEDPARLDPLVFQVGNAVAPFVSKSGADLGLAWPAVSGASGYAIDVFDLATGSTVACPAGLDCAPLGTSTTFSGGAVSATGLGFRVLAIDGCADRSAN